MRVSGQATPVFGSLRTAVLQNSREPREILQTTFAAKSLRSRKTDPTFLRLLRFFAALRLAHTFVAPPPRYQFSMLESCRGRPLRLLPRCLLLHDREPVALLTLVIQEHEIELQAVHIDDGTAGLIEREIERRMIEWHGPAAGVAGAAGDDRDF